MWERGFGFPRFKKRMRSFLFPQIDSNIIEGNIIKLPKLGKIRFRKSREIPEGFLPKQVRVIKQPSGYFILVGCSCDVDVPDVSAHGSPIGVDLGLNQFLATSEGELIQGHKFLKQSEGKLALLQRKLKNKKKGSRRWKTIKNRIAKLHEKITNCRQDFFFKTAHHLCDQAGMIFVEDLNLKALGKSALRKACLDASWGSFVEILSYVCRKRDVFFSKVNANGTSQVCPNCGVNCGKKTLSQRLHKCRECGYQADRDIAAAMVVKNRGVSSAGQSRKSDRSEGEDVILGSPQNVRRTQETLVEGKEIGDGNSSSHLDFPDETRIPRLRCR